ncbi:MULTISPECIES: flagellar hook-length control protein FliK [unclassified Massilia]|uniref:flagellar hook-length control protein FliK n=1 Tax=unclassified Massilia TaxID=2609279 RepID=UPI0013A5A19E|nr:MULTISPECIES: flagellar hook-length control protein FliK [unclassified Massilia]
MLMNTVSPSAPAQNADGAQPAQAVQAGADAQPGAGAALPFAEWLGQQAQGALLAVQSGTPTDAAQADAAPAAATDAPAAATDAADDDQAPSLPQDGALLAAMAMPLMPLSPAQIAQAVQAARPAVAEADGAGAHDAKSGDGKEVAAPGQSAPAAAADNAALALPQLAAVKPAQQAQAQPDAAPAARPAAQPRTVAGTAGDIGAPDKGAEHAGTSAGSAAIVAAAAPAQPAAAAPAADTVKLAGPPTAWRQSLQEALGDRLHVQVGNNIEQAVIRLEPPQLGRIDIAIRHSAGTLEVNISASNGEVLRQLQTVSDNLRSDLSQRQFSEVAVTVTPAPKNGAVPFGDPQQGRGRQQGREQEDHQPGRALAEAGNASSGASSFSLGGRE